MKWQDLLADGYNRVLDALEEALATMTPEDLDQLPHPDCNSMGWTTWHLSRGQDAQIADLMGEPQLWLSEKWYAKFKRKANPDDAGYGDTSEQVQAFRSPGVETLLAYHRNVTERTGRCIRTLSAKGLDRELSEPWYKPLPTVGVRLISILADDLEHAGQVAYVRGLLKGKGWSSV